MKYFLLLIFYAFTCCGMQQYSRLESLPTDLKLNIIKQIIRSSHSRKQAVEAVRKFIVGDRLLPHNDHYLTYQSTIEDHLGWCWNDERPMSFIPNTFLSDFFQNLPDQCCSTRAIIDLELCTSRQFFTHFCKMVKEKKAVPEEILNGIDLYHVYENQEPYKDTTLEITWIKRRTPLYVVTDANDETTAERLLQLGCDTQKLSDTGMNPLHLASKKGYTEIVALFIKHNVPLNAQTRVELKTAMHLAAEHGHMDIMQILIDAGADHTIKDKCGYTPNKIINNRVFLR